MEEQPHVDVERPRSEDRLGYRPYGGDRATEFLALQPKYEELCRSAERGPFDLIDLFGDPLSARDGIRCLLESGVPVQARDLGHGPINPDSVLLFTEPHQGGLVRQYTSSCDELEGEFANAVSSIMVGSNVAVRVFEEADRVGSGRLVFYNWDELSPDFDNDIESIEIQAKAPIEAEWIRDQEQRDLGLVFRFPTADIDFWAPDTRGDSPCSTSGYPFPVKTLEEWQAGQPCQLMINTSYFSISGTNYHKVSCGDVLGISMVDGKRIQTSPKDGGYALDAVFLSNQQWGFQNTFVMSANVDQFAKKYAPRIDVAVGGIIFVYCNHFVDAPALKLHKGGKKAARVAIGTTDNRDLVIVVIFPNTATRPWAGMTASELATLMMSPGYDVANAIMLDGGGSATVYATPPRQDSPRFFPAKPKDKEGYRPVPNVLAIVGTVSSSGESPSNN